MKLLFALISLLFSLTVAMPNGIVKSDTIKNGNTTAIKHYVENGYDSVLIQISTDYYENGVKTGYSIVWGDTLNRLLVDSITSQIFDNRTEVASWRNGNIYNQYTIFTTTLDVDVTNDSRNPVYIEDEDEDNHIQFNSYEVRVFCGRVVELYFLNGIKVYSTFTLTDCPDFDTDTTPSTIPDSVITIG